MINKNQQKSIKINEFTAYENLDERFQIAIDLKLDGYRYKYIGAVLKVKEQTVASWFTKGGDCERAFKQRKKTWRKETKKIFADIDLQIKEAAIDAMVTLKKAVRKGSVPAAMDILDRAGFKPKEKIELESRSDKKIDKMAEIITKLSKHVKSGTLTTNETAS